MRTTTTPPTMFNIHGITLYRYRQLDETAVSTMFQQLKDPDYNMWHLTWTNYWHSSEPDGSMFIESDSVYDYVIAPKFVTKKDIWEALVRDSNEDLYIQKVKSFEIRFVLEKKYATSSRERLLDIRCETEGDDDEDHDEFMQGL